MANTTSVILAVNQQKGGTGKTTTTACLGDALQRFLSKRVLLVDLDRQASLTDWLVDPFGQGIASDMAGIEDLLTGAVTDTGSVIRTVRDGLDILPATNGLDAAVKELENKLAGREKALTKTLAPLREIYEVIVVDCPPGISVLTVNVLVAADALIIPVEASMMSTFALRDLNILIGEINDSGYRAEDLKVVGVLPTKLRANTSTTLVLAELEKHFPVLPGIRQTVRAEEAVAAHKLLQDWSPGSTAADDYRVAAEKVAATLGMG